MTDPGVDGYNHRPAQRICGDCPVTAWCLARALDARDQDGVWGGTTPTQRLPMIVAWRADTERSAVA